ncbi:Hypothetical predicted protein, partial [Olea europaea subsp. europaea]
FRGRRRPPPLNIRSGESPLSKAAASPPFSSSARCCNNQQQRALLLTPDGELAVVAAECQCRQRYDVGSATNALSFNFFLKQIS